MKYPRKVGLYKTINGDCRTLAEIHSEEIAFLVFEIKKDGVWKEDVRSPEQVEPEILAAILKREKEILAEREKNLCPA